MEDLIGVILYLLMLGLAIVIGIILLICFSWLLSRPLVWIFPHFREQERAARRHRHELRDANKRYKEQCNLKKRQQRELTALGMEYQENRYGEGLVRSSIPFDKLFRWEGETVRRLIYSPAVKGLEIKVDCQGMVKNDGHVNAGERIPVSVEHKDYGSATVTAFAEGFWRPSISDGARPSPGDVVLELDTTPETLCRWHDERRREEEERQRAEAERLALLQSAREAAEAERRRMAEEWEAGREIREAMEKEARLRREKAEIADALMEKQRRRELEKQVRLELIDSGQLYSEAGKRPPIPDDVRDAVWRRDGERCVKCGSTENLQFDHIIPFSKGGATSIENLQLLCQKCNLEKSNKIG